MASPKERRIIKRNFRKICPISGCRSKPQVKLLNHLAYAHKNLTQQERAKYIKDAEKISRYEKNKVLPYRPVL